VMKAKIIEDDTKEAAAAYSRIITRYPAMDRAVDAKARLEALHQPVPRPTRAALKLNEQEEASRHEAGMMSSMLNNFEKHPDVAKAPHVGEPSMTDPQPVTATEVVKQMALAASGDNRVSVETTNGTVAPNQDAPRSDTPAVTDPAAAPGQPAAAASAADPNELKPNVDADPNALPPLVQSNQLEGGGTSNSASSGAPARTEEMADISSSKKKKKKGLSKLNPF
jgi:outer membrane protein assembly factor BamD